MPVKCKWIVVVAKMADTSEDDRGMSNLSITESQKSGNGYQIVATGVIDFYKVPQIDHIDHGGHSIVAGSKELNLICR